MGQDDPKIIEISRSLIKGEFQPAAKVYDGLKKISNADGVRYGIIAYFVGCLRRAKNYGDADRISQALDVLFEGRGKDFFLPIGKPGDWQLYNMLYKVARLLKG